MLPIAPEITIDGENDLEQIEIIDEPMVADSEDSTDDEDTDDKDEEL